MAFRNRVSIFKQRLREAGSALILEWVASDAGGTNVYERDLSLVRSAHMLVAILDEPSTGLGLEIGEAMREHKPILCMHRRDITPSKLLEAAAISGYLEIRSYNGYDEMVRTACEFITRQAARYRQPAFS
jgi:nucleoside 2-deoxyribosyltransferase